MSVFQGVKLIARRAGLIQPNGRLQINWNNSLTQHLTTFACVQNGRMINLCRPVDVPTLVNGSTSLPKATNHQWGKGLLFDGTSSLWLPQHNEDRDNFFGGKKTVFAQYIRTANAIDGSTPFCRTANNSIFGNATISYVSANLLLDATNFTTANWSTNSLNPMTLTANTITVGAGFWNLRQSLGLTTGHSYTFSGGFSGANHSLQWIDGNGIATHSGDNASSMTFTATTDFIMVAISNASGSNPGTVTVQNLKVVDNTAATQIGVSFLDDVVGSIQAKATSTHALRSLETIGGHVAIPAGSASGIFLDGFQSGTATFNNSSTSVDTNSNFIFGGTSDANVQNPFTGIVNFGLYATRSWTDAEMLAFYKAPWQIVKPFPRRTYFDSLIPTNTTLSPPDSPEFGFEAVSPTMTFGGPQNATSAEFGWETDGGGTLIQASLIGSQATFAEFGWEGSPPNINVHLTLIAVPPKFGWEGSPPTITFGGPQNATPAEFGWETNGGGTLTQVSSIGADSSSVEFGVETGNASLTQTNKIGANDTSAEFGWENDSPPVDFNNPIAVQSLEFGFEITPSFALPTGDITVDDFSSGWEGTSVGFVKFVPGGTPEARTLNIVNGHRIVRISGTFNITKVPITLPMSNPFSVTVYLCSSVILLCSDNSIISIAIG